MGLVSQDASKLPAALHIEQLVVEKQGPEEAFDLVVRDGKTGFVFFNISGHRSQLRAGTKSLGIKDGRLQLSDDFARKLGRPADAGSVVGKISISARLMPIEVDNIVNGKIQSAVMPAINRPRKWNDSGTGRHRGRSSLCGAGRKLRKLRRSWRGNDFCNVASWIWIGLHSEQRPPGYSAKYVSDERRSG